MGLITGLKNVVSKLLVGLDAVPGLARLKVIGRVGGVAGMLMQIASSIVESITSLSVMPFLQSLGLNLVGVSQGLVADVSALQAGASGMAFWYHTVGIYSKLWFVLFVTTLIAGYLKKMHLGGDIPEYQLYIVTFAFVITPVQMLGSVIYTVVENGALKRGQLLSVITPWNGIRKVLTNADLWLEPSLNLVSSAPSVSSPSTNETLNQSVQQIG